MARTERSGRPGEAQDSEAPPGWGYLMRPLAVPMVAVGVACAVGAVAVGNDVAQGALIEVAATCLGVLVTVFYVEVLLERREARRWARPTALIERRVKSSAMLRTDSILNLRDDYSAMTSRDARALAQRPVVVPDPYWLDYVERTAADVPGFLAGLHDWGWEHLAWALDGMAADYTLVGSLFGDRLEPEVFALVWRTQELAQETAHALHGESGTVTAGFYAEQTAPPRFPEEHRWFAELVEGNLAEVLTNVLALLRT